MNETSDLINLSNRIEDLKALFTYVITLIKSGKTRIDLLRGKFSGIISTNVASLLN